MTTAVWRGSFALALSFMMIVAGTSPAAAVTRQVALGVSVDIPDSQNMGAVDSFTTSVGHQPAIWALWSSWGAGDAAFPTAAAQSLVARGITPMINWSPTDGGTDCAMWSLDATINGLHDQYIRDWATAAKAINGTVIVRYAPELNGSWYIWGPGRCENGLGAKMKIAWQHVWNIVRVQVGAQNVKFLWSVYGTTLLKQHYPGNTYVDYMGLSAFNWAQPDHAPWTSMVGTMKTTVRALHRINKTKPIIVAEMGAGYNPTFCLTKCNKARYIATGYPAVYAKWPQIVGLVYFNVDLSSIGQPDWRLQSPTGALTAYRTIASDLRFQGHLH